MTRKEKEKRDKAKQNKLAWTLQEYDCRDLDEAKREAEKDPVLHRLLRECGILFRTPGDK